MARCLIIGCGCRGRELARSLVERGHVVRGTTRDPESAGAITAAAAEPIVGDPDRVATLVDALEHVTVVCVLLGSAEGSPEKLAALHGPRLEMLLTKLVDTTVRGVVYETRGSVDSGVLRGGAELVRRYGEQSLAEALLLDADPSDRPAWLVSALEAVEAVL